MKKRWLLVLFFVGAAVLTAGAFNRASAEVQWQQWGQDLYRTETEHFVFVSHVDPGKQENDRRADRAAAKAEEYYDAATKYIKTDRLDRKLGFYLEMANRKNWLKEKEIKGLFDDPFYVPLYPLGNIDYPLSSVITRILLRVKLKTADPPEWLDYGLADYVYWREIEQKPWADVRKLVDKTELSLGPISLNTLANPTTWTRRLNLGGKLSAFAGLDFRPESIFYFFENRFGQDKIAFFLDRCDGHHRYDAELAAVFAPRKALEAEWRLFVLFDGVSKLMWTETRADYRTQQPGVEIRLKKAKTLWFNEKVDETVCRLARSVGTTNEILGLTASDPRKIPTVTIEFNGRMEGTTVKQAAGGCLIKARDSSTLQTGTEKFAELYAGQALRQANMQQLPEWALAGLNSFLTARVSGQDFAGFRENVSGWAVKDWNSMSSPDDEAAFASLLWFIEGRYSPKAVGALLGSLNSGVVLEQAVASATSADSAAVYHEWLRALILPAKPALNWKEAKDGLEVEVSGLRVLIPWAGQMLTVDDDGEQVLVGASKTIQALERITGFRPGSSVQISLAADRMEIQADLSKAETWTIEASYLNDNALARALVQCWLTRMSAGKPDSIPAWVGEGLTWYAFEEVGQATPASETRNSLGEVYFENEAWCAPWDPATSYDASESEAWGTAIRLLIEQYGSKSQVFFGWVAGKGADAALKEALGKDFVSFASEWLTYIQIQSVSQLSWSEETRDEESVVFKTTVQNITVRVVMPVQSLIYCADLDEILGQVGKWAEAESRMLGLAAVPALGVKLYLDDDGGRIAFAHNDLAIAVSDNLSGIWALDQAIAFEMGRALIEYRWKLAGGKGSAPAWLTDGLAAYMTYQQTDITLLGTPDPIPGWQTAVEGYSPELIQAEEPFALACIFRFLNEKYPNSPGRMVDSLAGGASLGDAVRASTGKDMSSLEKEFSEAVKGW